MLFNGVLKRSYPEMFHIPVLMLVVLLAKYIGIIINISDSLIETRAEDYLGDTNGLAFVHQDIDNATSFS